MTDKQNINLREQSLVHQIECPDIAKTYYNTTLTDLSNSSIPYVFGKAIPNAIGYLNYNFTGLGSNDANSILKKMGLAGSYSKSVRVLGYNYFYETGATCNSQSVDECVDKPQYTYIRNYPVGIKNSLLKGNMTFGMFNDLVDLNPMPIIRSVLQPGTSTKCQMSSVLSVGSFIDNPSLKFQNKEDFEQKMRTCLPTCTNILDSSDQGNCIKKCLRGHWTDSQCVSVLMNTPQNEPFQSTMSMKNMNYLIPPRKFSKLFLLFFILILMCFSIFLIK